jgi:hypothetical protein
MGYDQTIQKEHEEYAPPVTTNPASLQLAEHVSYGPDGIRGLLTSNYVFWAAFLASLGGFSFGYDQGVMSM